MKKRSVIPLAALLALAAGCATTKGLEETGMKNTAQEQKQAPVAERQTPTVESQTLGMETLGNARELGGLRTADGRTVKRGVLLRSAKPCGASDSDRARLTAAYHLAVITDFRMSYERALEPNPEIAGVSDIWCPIIDEDLVRANLSGEKATQMQAGSAFEKLKIAVDSGIVGEDMYVNFLSGAQGKKGYNEFFAQLKALPAGSSLLFHCTQGKDRTGLGAMLILSALGVDEETIMADYLLTNEFNAKLIEKERAMLSSYNLSEEQTALYLSVMDYVNPVFMQKALTWLKTAYGSPLGYIQQELGVTDADLEALKAKFLD